VASDIRKFINAKFLRTIELGLMQELFTRHFGEGEVPLAFHGEPGDVRDALTKYFEAPVNDWSEGVIADLHRVAELGTSEGMGIILNEARRQGVMLYPEPETDDGDSAPVKHDAKHVALHTYLNHHRVFEAAADFQALRAPSAMAEFRGPERDVDADLTEETKSAFRAAMVELLAQDLHGEYCRLGPYEEEGEINLVVSHGARVTTTPIVAGDREEIITLRAMKYAAIRYSPAEGLLRIGGVAKARQGQVAETFAKFILARPGFFSGKDARDLYTLDPPTETGPDFEFEHRYDERIEEVRIVKAAADLFDWDEEEQKWRYVRTLESRNPSGAALRDFRGSEVRFGRGWRLGEITFRVFFKTDAKRPAQVTVRLKPPGTLAFRRTRFEKAIHALVARNGLEKDRDADLVVEAAE
jgi:hypothetical protein